MSQKMQPTKIAVDSINAAHQHAVGSISTSRGRSFIDCLTIAFLSVSNLLSWRVRRKLPSLPFYALISET